MDTEKITKFYDDAINRINGANENDRNGIIDYLIGFYANMSADNLSRYTITKKEATEIANRLRSYRENGLNQETEMVEDDTISTNTNNVTGNNINNDLVTRIVNNAIDAINSNNSLNTADNSQALSHINFLIDHYTKLSGDEMRREGITSYDDTREIARRLTEYRDNVLTNRKNEPIVEEENIPEEISETEISPVKISKETVKPEVDDNDKFKELDAIAAGHIRYAETLEPSDRIEHINKTIDYYNTNDKFTKEDKEYIIKCLTEYKNTLEDGLDNKSDNQNQNKESRIKVVGKRVCKWISNHKKQILIGVGCAAIATGLFAISASAIPTLMATNSTNWWVAKSVGNVALMNTLHANNIALGAKIGAVFAAKTGTWTVPAGAIIGKGALVSAVAGISGFGVSSVLSALHKKFVPKTNSNGEEIISKEEAKIYYDKGYKKGLKSGRKEANDREYNDGFDAGYDAALDDIEKDDKFSNDKNKTSFQSLRNGFARLFNKSKQKNDDEWEPIVNNNNNRPSLSEREDGQEHFANNGVENPETEQNTMEDDVARDVATSVAGFMAEKNKNDDIWTIAYRAGVYYIENREKANIDAEIKALKDKLVLDTPEKVKDWELGFNDGIDDYKKKTNMTSVYLNLEQLNNLNPGANITLDELHPNILYSDIDANLLTLPNGWYYNDKNGITNKHNTEAGVYQTYTVEKYQEEMDKPGSHRR